MAASNFSTGKPAQLINGAGNFNEGVGRELDLEKDNGLVGVVSIMGVQSSGKSTLMNNCFSTEFKEMNEEMGMSRTTQGIWMSKLSFTDDSAHKILLLDCEGSDGAERGLEGNETFEKQVTLFALASSDVVIINMKCDNVNLYNGASMPLIRTVFQVMVRRFNTRRRVTLLFVLRDKNKAPLEKLRYLLTKQVGETWQNMCKELPTPYPELEDYFKVEVKALSHYKYEEEAFLAEVVELREWVFELVKNGRLSPAANFISLTKKNWSDIQADKILNLVSNKNAVDEVFFNSIKENIIKKFSHDKKWTQLKMDVRIDMADHFGANVSSLIDTYLSEFDDETKSFDARSREVSKMQVTKRLLEVIEDTYLSFLENKKLSALQQFEAEVAQKIEALDSNFDTKMYTKTLFENLIEAKVEQADDWNQPYECFEEAKSNINRYVGMARDIITRRKEMEANKANPSKKNRDAAELGKVLGNLALAAAAIYYPPAGVALAAAKKMDGKSPAANDDDGNEEPLPLHEKISSA